MGLKLEVISSITACESLRTDWEQLLASCPQATVFDSFGWVKANLLAFPNPETWILVFHDPDSVLVGVIPLVVRSGRRYLRELGWLEFAGQPYADYGSCLVRPGWEMHVAEGLAKFCSSKGVVWDAVYLEKFKADNPLLAHLTSAGRDRGLAIRAQECDRIRRLTKQEYAAEGRGGGDSHKSLRKARHRLMEQGEIGFEVHDHAEAILERLDTFFSWHVARFTNKGLRSPLVDAQHQAFYRHVVEQLAPRGQIWLSVLTCGGRAIAMRCSPLFQGTLHLYSTCFDQAFARYSPSMLQLQMLLDYAFQAGIGCVDFGVGESPQKDLALTGARQTVVTLEIYSNKVDLLESHLYQAAEQARSRSRSIRWLGKLFRRMSPYNVR